MQDAIASHRLVDRDTVFQRQLDIVDITKLEKVEISVIGAGAVGSFVTLALAKMGVKEIDVFDFDTIERHNLPNQFYRLKDIGKPKVEALKEIVEEFTGSEIVAFNEEFVAQHMNEIIICCVDSMDVRAKIWEKAKHNLGVKLFLDTRMGAELANLLVVRMDRDDDKELYESRLFPSSEASELPCTAKAIIYTVLGISEPVARVIKQYVMGQLMDGDRLRTLDFVSGINMDDVLV